MTDTVAIPLPLRPARVHEASGPGAMGFAAILGGATDGPIIWIRESWIPEELYPAGLAAIVDPDRLVLARTKDQTDTLAVAEEALKDGALPFVILDVSRPLNLREGRRLQLAAQAGASTGLCLIPEGMGSNAAETRWFCAPVFDPKARAADSTVMRWDIIKNKKGTLGSWHVRWDRTARRLDLVSPVGQRPGAAGVSG